MDELGSLKLFFQMVCFIHEHMASSPQNKFQFKLLQIHLHLKRLPQKALKSEVDVVLSASKQIICGACSLKITATT
jgi:hypothetical protein